MNEQRDIPTPSEMSRRLFLGSVATGTALLPAIASGQAPPPGKEALRSVADAAELAITDEQLGKLAGAVSWGRGELRKLREVEVGTGAPAPVFLPATPAPKRGGDGHE